MTDVSVPRHALVEPEAPSGRFGRRDLPTAATRVSGERRRQATGGIPLTRGVAAEIRKLLDTRASRVLAGFILVLGVIGGAAYVAALGTAALPVTGPVAWNLPTSYVSLGVGLLTPALVVLLVTTEFTQRVALITFTLEPRRGRVLVAKAVVAVLAAIAAFLVTHLLDAVASLIAGTAHSGVQVTWTLHPAALAGQFATTTLGLAVAFAWALCLRHTAAALIAYYAIPTVLQIAGMMGPAVAKWLDWISLTAAEQTLTAGHIHGVEWAHLAVSVLVFIGAPLVVGTVRLIRSEVQ